MDTNAIIAGWIASQTNLQTLSAEFVQIRKLKSLAEPVASAGKLWFASPNRFRWELGDPPQSIAIRQTNELIMISPGLERVEKFPLGGPAGNPWDGALSLLESGFPRDLATFRRQYRVRSVMPTNQTHVIVLQPAAAAARRMVSQISVIVSDPGFELVANEIQLADGSILRNEFKHCVRNALLPDRVFDPSIPPGFKVIQAWKKR